MEPLIIGIGEILWDMFPAGPRMGGAPANFACHARALGADGRIVSRVGDDAPGASLLTKLEETGMPVSGISYDAYHPTGSVSVDLMDDGQPVFTIEENVAWDHLAADSLTKELFSRADAVCFGTLGQRAPASAATIRALVAMTPAEALRVLDVNLRQNHYSAATLVASLELANVLKLSDAELPEIASMLGFEGSLREKLAKLISRFDLRLIVYTRGSQGSVLFDGEEWCEHPGLPTEVSNTVGAGDSFTAAVAVGLLKQWRLETISAAANEVAAHVCSCDGAVPSMPDSLRALFQVKAALPPKARSLA
ncbi:MAG: carbohydrate kinase [Verrucomicrobiota bacterium]